MSYILDIIYTSYYDLDGKTLTIGGIQTYITHLYDLASRMGLETRILQYANIPFQKTLAPGVTLIGLTCNGKHDSNNLYKEVERTRDASQRYITLFATDHIIPSQRVKRSIAIQHGISWDIESRAQRSFLKSFASKALNAYRIVNRLRNIEDVVCVDHNFICWHRTQLHERDVRLIPILNFTEIGPATMPKHEADSVSIVFARRFFPYRGTRLFAEAIKSILDTHSNIKVTFAGNGPDEQYLKDRFSACPNVTFTHYTAEESLAFHSQFDIAVVPTTGSEGTSLSLLEAMSAHCAVVCTNVGGMTNIVIDGYNGIMVSPDANELHDALLKLIEDSTLRQHIAEKGYETVAQSFSLSKWEERWQQVLQSKMK